MLDIFMEVDNIDKKATKENVDELLSLYRRLARMADEEFLPKRYIVSNTNIIKIPNRINKIRSWMFSSESLSNI